MQKLPEKPPSTSDADILAEEVDAAVPEENHVSSRAVKVCLTPVCFILGFGYELVVEVSVHLVGATCSRSQLAILAQARHIRCVSLQKSKGCPSIP